MLVPARMLSGGGASVWMFFFFGWAAAVCHTVPRITYSNKNLSRFHRSSSCELHIVMDPAADWVIKRCSVNLLHVSHCASIKNQEMRAVRSQSRLVSIAPADRILAMPIA